MNATRRRQAWSGVLAMAATVGTLRGAAAWGRVGHRAASALAESRLTPSAASAVRALLEPDETLPSASLWADLHKRDIPGSAALHYVNVPLTQSRYEARYCAPSGCVVSQLLEVQRALASGAGTRAERQFALRMLVHLMEDLHQPMHVGDWEDRGGNDLPLRFFAHATNLHRLWDDELIEHHSTDETVWSAELARDATPEQSRLWLNGTLEDWASESLVAARTAHCFPGTNIAIVPGARLSDDYVAAQAPMVRLRLAQAGVRLAAWLNQIFP